MRALPEKRERRAAQSPGAEPATGGRAAAEDAERRSVERTGMTQTGRAVASALRLQTLVAVGLALLLLAKGPVAAYSSLFGSLAVWLPAWAFSLVVVRRVGGDSTAFLRAVAVAEAGKLVLTGVFCAVVFIWVRPLAAGWFFAGMIAVLAAGWIGGWIGGSTGPGRSIR